MAWLYVPAPAGSTWPFKSPNPDTELYVTLSGKPQRRPLSWRGWKTRPYIRRLSGTMLAPSMADRGVDAFISSLPAIRASRTRQQEKGSVQLMTAGLSTKCYGLSKKCGLFVSSVKTSRGTRTDNLPLSSRHWKEWAIALRQEYSQRQKLARATSANDCSSWPTARANHAEKRGNVAALSWSTPNAPNGGRSTAHATMKGRTAYHNGKKVQVGLESQVKNWPTPKTITGGANSKRSERSAGGPDLQEAVKGWPTLAARDYRTPNAKPYAERGGASKGEQLPNYVAHNWTTPAATDGERGGKLTPNMSGTSLTQQVNSHSVPLDQMTDHGATYLGWTLEERQRFLDTLSTNQVYSELKTVLNPLFVEWLMGWPIGLTDFDCAVTGFTQWLVRSRTELSTLCLPVIDEQPQFSMF